MQNLQNQIQELQQTPEHNLKPFEARLRKIVIAIYELLEDVQQQNRELNNRIESMSTDKIDVTPVFVTRKKNKT